MEDEHGGTVKTLLHEGIAWLYGKQPLEKNWCAKEHPTIHEIVTLKSFVCLLFVVFDKY